MSLPIDYAEHFQADVDLQLDWYVKQQDSALGLRYAAAVRDALLLLAQHPYLGLVKNFRHRRLTGVRLLVLDRPFQAHLLFYKVDGSALVAFRMMSGFRDLPRRLLQPPGAE